MLKTTPRDYQEDGIKKASPFEGFGIFSEQRTGKTLIALAIVDKRRPRRLLIVGPLKALPVWEAQIKEHLEIDWPCEIRMINFETLQRQRHSYKRWIRDDSRSMVIIDEAHKIKKRGSKQSRACRLIGSYAESRLALTGTPLSKQKSIEDAWAIFNFIDPSIFGTYEEFAEKHLIMGGFKNKKVVGYRNQKLFLRKYHAFSFRRTMREARKRPLRIRKVKLWVPMPKETRERYKELKKKLETVIQRKKIRVPQVMNLATKLQQFTGGWVIHKDPRTEVVTRLPLLPNPKLEKIRYLMRKHLPKDKLLICVKYIHEIEGVVKAVKGAGYTCKTIQGGQPFDGNFREDVIVIQIASGMAIDLSDAHIIVWYSWDHSYINHDQMRFRVLSYKTDYVLYYYLLMEGSVDLKIYEAVARKKKLADLICDQSREN